MADDLQDKRRELSTRLVDEVLAPMKSAFVGKDEIIDLLGVCLVAGENLFLLGPPGTAKSALVQDLARRIEGRVFDYLLTRFTEPNELFGPFDIRKLREGELVTNTEGMLPEASLVFLDELLNANSAILNSLLMVLNERVFRRGQETRPLPTLMVIGASNRLPEDDALGACSIVSCCACLATTCRASDCRRAAGRLGTRSEAARTPCKFLDRRRPALALDDGRCRSRSGASRVCRNDPAAAACRDCDLRSSGGEVATVGRGQCAGVWTTADADERPVDPARHLGHRRSAGGDRYDRARSIDESRRRTRRTSAVARGGCSRCRESGPRSGAAFWRDWRS